MDVQTDLQAIINWKNRFAGNYAKQKRKIMEDALFLTWEKQNVVVTFISKRSNQRQRHFIWIRKKMLRSNYKRIKNQQGIRVIH